MSTDKAPPPPTRDVEWKVEMACRILDGTPASDQSAALEAAAGALAKAEAEYEAAVDAFEAAGKAYRDAVDELTQAGDQWERASEQESKEASARSDAASKAVTKAFRAHRLATLTFDEAMDVLGDPLEAARRTTVDGLRCRRSATSIKTDVIRAHLSDLLRSEVRFRDRRLSTDGHGGTRNALILRYV